jgi:hypothetical protein
MNRRTAFRPPSHSRQRDLFIKGVQLAAGLLMAQQIAGKAARDGLFLSTYGPRALPAMIAGAAAFSIVLSLLSGRLMLRSAPRVVVPRALLVSGLLLVGEWWLLGVRSGLAAILIYLHMAGLGTVLLSTFWSMLNEEFDPREAKRRFGQIAAGGTIGGLVGGVAAERTVAWFGPPILMLELAGLHLVCAALLVYLSRRSESTGPRSAQKTVAAGAARAVSQSALLKTLAAIVLLGSVGAALLDYVFKVYATQTWGQGRELLRYFAFFYTGVAVLSFLLQSAAAKLFLGKFGLGKTVLTMPGTLLSGSLLALLIPGAAVAAAARAAEAAVRGSLFRAGYETCYTPVPAAQKRLAKTFIDVVSERGGDALGAGIVMVCLSLAGASSPAWILGIASLLAVVSLLLCQRLEQIYVKALGQSLMSQAVQINPDAELDLTTRSLVLRTAMIPAAQSYPPNLTGSAPQSIGETAAADPVVRKLIELRSSDPARVQEALLMCDVSDPLVATQVCLLLGQNEYALMAHGALFQSVDKVLGLLTDLMTNPALDVAMRRRIPRIIGAARGQRAIEALLAGLEDSRFEIRLQCGKALDRCARQAPPRPIPPEKVIAAVDRELSVGRVLWESQRTQHSEPGEFGPEWLDELLSNKAHGSLEHVFTLLSLLYDRKPLMAAFRSLHVEDKFLRGTALEYLEGVLPEKTRELLWEIIQERPPLGGIRQAGEVMNDLLKSSETVVMRLRQDPTVRDSS